MLNSCCCSLAGTKACQNCPNNESRYNNGVNYVDYDYYNLKHKLKYEDFLKFMKEYKYKTGEDNA